VVRNEVEWDVQFRYLGSGAVVWLVRGWIRFDVREDDDVIDQELFFTVVVMYGPQPEYSMFLHFRARWWDDAQNFANLTHRIGRNLGMKYISSTRNMERPTIASASML